MQRVDFVTIGSAVKDMMFFSDDIIIQRNKKKDFLKQYLLTTEYGAKHVVDDVYFTYGGGALNVGRGLRNFGLRVAPLIAIGDDAAGGEIMAYLHKYRFNVRLVSVLPNAATGFSMILASPKDRDHTIFAYKGATKALKVSKDLYKVKTRWYYIAPLSMAHWTVQFKRVVKEVKRHSRKPANQRVRLAWTLGKQQLRELVAVQNLLPYVDVIFMNKEEAIECCIASLGRKVVKKRLIEAHYLLDSLKKIGMRNIVVTDGARGVYGLDEKGKYHYKSARRVTPVDTVGAGDAFVSGFLAAYQVKGSFSQALTLGAQNSASVIKKIGAQNGLLKQKL